MNERLILTTASLLSILLVACHISDDIVRGFEPGGLSTLRAVLMLVTWLYGALMLTGRRSGYVIMLLGAILGTLVSIAHMRGVGYVGGRVANSSGMFFWVFTQFTLGVTAIFSLILSARGLWQLRGGRARAIPA